MASVSTEDILRDKKTNDPNSITSLTFTHKAFSNVPSLSAFKKLEKLDLSFNNLSSLQGLEGCVSLKWLCVQQNKLLTLKGIETLTNLTVFNAGKNKLRSMDEVKNLLKLCALILNDNEIASISGLDQLTELNTLVLSRNPITKMGNSLAKLKSIVKVSLSNCQLDVIDSSIKACTGLEQLRLSHNEIKTLPEELAYNKKLHILDVGNNMLSRWSDIEALSSLPNLKNLNLLGNPIAEKAKLLKKINKLAPSLQIFNSKRMDQLNHVQKKQKSEQHNLADAGNDVVPVKKKPMDDVSHKQVKQHVPSKGLKVEKSRELQEDDNSDNEEKFGKASKVEAATEGAKMKPDEDYQMKKAKKKENRAEKEVLVKETDRTEKDKKSKRKAEETSIDDIDDKEKSFMDLIASDAPDNANIDGERRDRSVGNKDTIGALVTYPARNKKAKKAQTSVFEMVTSTPDVGLGGPSAWDV